MKKIKLAVVGCGAIAKAVHLPGCMASEAVEVTLLVDRDEGRAQELADEFGVKNVATDVADVARHAEAALLALPNFLHAPISLDLIGAGVHVLVEKPLATSTEDCHAMCKAARNAGVVLSTGLICRLYPSLGFVREALRGGLIGELVSYNARQGFPLEAWPVASDYLFRKEKAGGGVLMDMGIHLLDLLQWWLGMPEQISYRDDSLGGVEANCMMEVSHEGGTRGVIELSRTRTLRNTLVLEGTRGEIEVSLAPGEPVRLRLPGSSLELAGPIGGGRGEAVPSLQDCARRQVEAFAAAVRGESGESVSGEDATRSVEWVERCYQSREPLRLPWTDPEVLGIEEAEEVTA